MLKKYVSFDVAIGSNFRYASPQPRLYISTDVPQNMILLANLFRDLHLYDAEQLPSVISSLGPSFVKA